MFEILSLGFFGLPSHHALCRFWLFVACLLKLLLLFLVVAVVICYIYTVNRTNLMFHQHNTRKVSVQTKLFGKCFLLCRLTNTFCVIFDLFYYIRRKFIPTKYQEEGMLFLHFFCSFHSLFLIRFYQIF